MFRTLVLLFLFSVSIFSKKENCDEDGMPCEEGWKLFERPKGGWCMKVFYQNNIPHEAAEKQCQEHKATLSGFQDQRESLYVVSTVLEKIYPGTGSVRFGLKRRKDCYYHALDENCTALNSFEWTDGFTTGTDGILWDRDQPDNSWGWAQRCAMLIVSPGGYSLNSQAGTMDDIQCDFDFVKNKEEERQTRAFVCGKRAAF
ncbi:unnamed protein product [Caenorhabditis brenneri]